MWCPDPSRRPLPRRWGPALAGLALLGGCSTTEGPLADRGTRYCLQAGALGAAGGAAAGALLGRAAAGGRDNSGAMLAGALIGGVVGAVTACRYGVWVADRRQTYETRSAQLAAEKRNAQATNESLVALNGRLREGLAERRHEVARLEQASRAGTARVAEKERLVGELERNREGMQTQLAQAEKELAVHRRTLAELRGQTRGVDPAEIEAYRRRVGELETNVAELRTLTQQYAAASGRVARL